ncbi:MAG: nitroreductase family protein [Candidatus Bathyarchaeia archaeon]|jgi:nitroreductase
MDAYECVLTKLDVREFDSTNVPAEVKLKVLEAARATGSGMNVQVWRFILVQGRERLKKLAQDSTTGQWVEHANFAVIILTDPKGGFHIIDAGRATQDMQLAAWNYGVVSCVFTGFNLEALRKDFSIPKELAPSIIIGFGYPGEKISGKKKNRKPLTELVYLDEYGKTLDAKQL